MRMKMSKKLPKYLDKTMDFIAEKEEKYLGVPKDKAKKEMIKEAIEESMTAKNPVRKKKLKVKRNPPVPVPKEMSLLEKEYFKKTRLAREISEDKGATLYREFELLAQKYSDLILEGQFKLKMERTKNESPTALEFHVRSEREKNIEAVRNRYYRLFLESFIITTLMKFADFTKDEIVKVVSYLEQKKTLSQLTNSGNRSAHSVYIYDIVTSKLLKNYDPERIYKESQSPNWKMRKKDIYAKYLKEAQKRYQEIGEKGAEIVKEERENLKRREPLPPLPENKEKK